MILGPKHPKVHPSGRVPDDGFVEVTLVLPVVHRLQVEEGIKKWAKRHGFDEIEVVRELVLTDNLMRFTLLARSREKIDVSPPGAAGMEAAKRESTTLKVVTFQRPYEELIETARAHAAASEPRPAKPRSAPAPEKNVEQATAESEAPTEAGEAKRRRRRGRRGGRRRRRGGSGGAGPGGAAPAPTEGGA